jgi:hypothetical protein
MITTMTFLMLFCGAVTGVGVGDGDEEFTPPQPAIAARQRAIRKNDKIFLKPFTSVILELSHGCTVGSRFHCFLMEMPRVLSPLG